MNLRLQIRLVLLLAALLVSFGCKKEKSLEEYGGPINFPEPQSAEGSGEEAAPQPTVPHVMAQLEELDGASEPGYLTVNGEADGHVYIDGRPIGQETPVEGHAVAPGRHTIQIASGEHTAFSRVFNSLNNPGRRTAVYLRNPEDTLQDPLGERPNPPAVLRIASSEPGVIIINGRRTQLVPPQVLQLPPGEYSFQVYYSDDTLSRQYQITLLPGEPRHLELAGADQMLFRSGSIREEGRGLTEDDFSQPGDELPDFSGFVVPTPTLELSLDEQTEGSGAVADEQLPPGTREGSGEAVLSP